MGIDWASHRNHSQVIITSGRSNNSSRRWAPVPTWRRADLLAALPWEVLQLCSSSYLSQGQPYQTTPPSPTNLTPRITLPLSIGLPPGGKRERGKKKGQPSLPPLFHLEPSSTAPPPCPPTPPFSPQHSTFPVGVCKARITLRPQLVRCQKH